MTDATLKAPAPALSTRGLSRFGLRLRRLPVRRLIVPGLLATAIGALTLQQLARSGGPGLRPHLPDWSLLAAASPVVQAHVAAAVVAFVIGAGLLAGVKGGRVHRTLGYGFVVLMLVTAATSFFIRSLQPGHLSYIHLISGWVTLITPVGVMAARRRNIRRHRRIMTGLFLGGLVVAGGFTFLPGRLMWQVFLG